MTMDLAEGIQVRVQSQFERALQQLPGVFEGKDIEALHRYRVALRKARSLLKLFSKELAGTPAEELSESLAEQARIANHARDLDVFHDQLEDSALRDRVHSLRQEAYQQLYHDLEQMADEREKCEHLVTAPWTPTGLMFEESVKQKWDELHNKIIKRRITALKKLDDDHWHRLRLTMKKQRYLIALCIPDRTEEEAQRWQDVLGHFNDLCCQLALLKAFKQEKSESGKIAKRLYRQYKHDKKESLVQLERLTRKAVDEKCLG